MNILPYGRWRAVCAAGMILLAHTVPAAAQRGDVQERMRELQMQLRQSEQERNALRSEVARLRAQPAPAAPDNTELDRARKEAADSVRKQKALVADAAATSGRLEQTATALKQAQDELAKLRVERTRETQALWNSRALLATSTQAVALRDELMGLCRTRNKELYEVGHEILARYREVGFREVLGRREKLLGLTQVKLDNLVQGFEDQLREKRVYDTTLPPSLEKRMQDSLATPEGATPPAN